MSLNSVQFLRGFFYISLWVAPGASLSPGIGRRTLRGVSEAKTLSGGRTAAWLCRRSVEYAPDMPWRVLLPIPGDREDPGAAQSEM